ncbi:MAG: glycosyltransferase [Pseudomonadales bacterium]
MNNAARTRHDGRAGVRACLFGTYLESAQYSRPADLREALQELGYEVSMCRAPIRENTNRATHFANPFAILGRVSRILLGWVSLAWQFCRMPRQDLIVVAYPAHADVILARLLCSFRRTPIVMDAFIGLHDTIVQDRALVAPGSHAARLIRLLESLALRCADRILIDTLAQAQSLSSDYKLSLARFVPIPLGIDEAVWFPSPMPPAWGKLRVLFWGTFIPLHGIDTIVAAARALDTRGIPVEITLIGWGQTAPDIAASLLERPVACLQWQRALVAPEEIAASVRASDCTLGIFGTSAKAARVVPYKIYQAMACARPIVTSDTVAARTYLVDDENCVLVPPGDPEALADALARLQQDPALRTRLAESAGLSYREQMSHALMRERLRDCLRNLPS